MPSSGGFRNLAEGLERKDPKAAKPFHEYVAVHALRESGLAPELPWSLLRRGCADLEEPDFVLGEPDAPIVAGIEITELENKSARCRNAKLRELQTSRQRAVGRKKRRSNMVEVMNDADKAFSEAGGAGGEYQYLQKFVQTYTEDQLQQAIVDRIEDKKTKPFYKNVLYPVHLIVYLRDYIICKGDAQQAIQHAAAHDAGRFASVWYVDHDWSVVSLKP